jgi:hypothetical protein
MKTGGGTVQWPQRLAPGPRVVFDIESDGLLDSATKVHCVTVADLDSDKTEVFGPKQIKKGLTRLKALKACKRHRAKLVIAKAVSRPSLS